MGERLLTDGNLPMGRFELKGIPPAARGAPRIKVEFSIDTACMLTARAAVEGSGIVAEGMFKPPLDLDAEAVAKVLDEAQKAQEADELALRLAEVSIRANGLIGQAEEKLKGGPNKDISEAVAALGLALAENNPDAIRERSDVIESLIPKLSARADFSEIFSQFFGSGTPSPSTARSAAPPRRQSGQQTSPPEETLTASPNVQKLGKIFGGSTFTLDPQLCFVIMPFGEKLQPIYEDSIRPTVEAVGLRCERADEARGTTLITWDIWERINRSRFLVADLTDLNANVFYELGLAHALSKEVVLITQSMEFVPFDLKALRCICYDMTRRGTERLEQQLAATMAALMKM